MGYRIGSFNLFKLNYQSDKEIKKDFQKIAQIIKDNNIDILAIQEVLTENAAKRLTNELGRNYAYKWAQPKRNGATAHQLEGYAFIWNTRRIELVHDENIENPRIYDNYHLLPGKKEIAKQVRLARDPFYGRFQPKALPRVEFRIINTHIIFSKNNEIDKKEDESNLQKGDIYYRKNEFELLTKSIYREIAKNPKNNKVLYTILTGDYNLSLVNYPQLHLNPIQVEDMKLVTVQREKTSLKQPPSGDNPEKLAKFQKGITSLDDCYAHDYDHFTYDTNRFEGIEVQYDRINTLGKHTATGSHFEKLQEHRTTISDHVPIFFDIELNPPAIILFHNQTGEKNGII